MGLKKSLIKRYYRWCLPRKRWHIIPVLPELRIKPAATGGKEIYYRGKLVCQTKPLADLKQFAQDNCFIVANGPSINEIDLTQLNDQMLFAVNGSTALTHSHGLKFKLYVVIDPGFPKKKLELVRIAIESGAHCLFSYRVMKVICDQDPTLLQRGNIYLIEEINRAYSDDRLPADEFYSKAKMNSQLVIHPTAHPENTKVGFSKNIEIGAFDSGTVAFWVAQIAYYIGFQNIFILGMDLGSSGKLIRFYETDEKKMPCHLNENYDILIQPGFECLASILSEPDCPAYYNVSLNSRLPAKVIPKLSFDDALEKLSVSTE